jgi:hypothetical protein
MMDWLEKWKLARREKRMRELYKRRPKVITAEDKRTEEDWEEEWASEAFALEEQRRLLNQRGRQGTSAVHV